MASSNRQFDALVTALLGGSITADESVQLDRLMKNDPQLVARYLEATQIHLDLKHLASHPENSVVNVAPANDKNWKRALYGILASVTVVSIAILALATQGLKQEHAEEKAVVRDGEPPLENSADTPVPLLPRIAESANAKIYGRGLAPRSGEFLRLEEEQILTRGSLALLFPSGARAIITAPSVFSATDTETLLLKSGKCSVYAPPGAEGFQVTTPSADIIDYGTRFAVGVDVTGETALHVVDGAAAYTSKELKREPVLLHEGESAFIDRAFLPTPEIPAAYRVDYLGNLRDRVIRYEATLDEDGLAEELLTLTVQRGGEVVTYDRDQLTPARLVGFTSNAGSPIFCTRRGDPLPEGEQRLSLLTDWSLVTGIINPRPSIPRPQAGKSAGMTIQFDPPVINGPGPEIVLFDLQLLVNAESGESIRISTPESRERNQWLDISQFDLDLTSPEALDLSFFQVYGGDTDIESIEGVVSAVGKSRKQTYVRAKGLATAIDLSDLGYLPGETAAFMSIEDYVDDKQSIDPVLIVTLPPMDAQQSATEDHGAE